MEPVIVVGDARVVFGDCRDVLKTLADNSVDSVVTDPPYELGFMGKKWDSTGIAYDVSVWVECLRVLKPGGHVLAFGGSRTWHRMAVAIEDAGFEIRDSIAWMYGSGFPKSLDVSKAIDKGMGKNRERQLEFVAWMRKTGLKAGQINAAIGMSDVGSHYLRHDQPAIATADLFDLLRPLLPPVPESIERLVAERTGIEWTEYKKRVVTGSRDVPAGHAFAGERYSVGGSEAVEIPVTLAHTPEAKKWEGWGTALKPAFEPIVVGRKPFAKGSTVAQNVLLHGVGGLNIDASRIGSFNDGAARSNSPGAGRMKSGKTPIGTFERSSASEPLNENQGRWPANVILDEYSAGLLDEQSGVSVSKAGGMSGTHPGPMDWGKEDSGTPRGGHTDSGGASRFFYCAKASKRDRNEGLDGLEPERHADRVADDGVGGKNPRNRTNTAKQNFHPTVKPTTLMRYLIKLVTPAGGTVLDPFTGSGSTGKAALLDGYDFVGVELTEEYLPIIEGRLRWAIEQEGETDGTLF